MARTQKKPFVWYRSHNGTDVCMGYDTYAILRSKMKELMADSIDNVLNVTRTRRGEWGQWFEEWHIDESTNKLTKVKEGWL
jgi:hypothetical protein